MNAHVITQALLRRYGKHQSGTAAERWICISEARSGAGHAGNNGQCDFLAINAWQGRGMELVGHEIKVSMTDLRKELADPAKAERFARYCRKWYLVLPAGLANKVKHEVPPAWGLLSVGDAKISELQAPEVRKQPEDVPAWWWIGWLAQIDRHYQRAIPHLVSAALAPERERMAALLADEERRAAARMDARHERHAAFVDALSAACGRPVADEHRHLAAFEIERLGRLYQAARGGFDLTEISASLRRVADTVDAVQAATMADEQEPGCTSS